MKYILWLSESISISSTDSILKKVLHRSGERGKAEHGWLHSRHSFSFAYYFNPEKMGFGLLRVLNDDIVEPGTGFGTHPHNNMEIISIVLAGALEHKDSMGSISVIYKDEVQVMSAGTGITHSEYNHSKTDKVNFLQLWIIPKERDIEPRYDQRSFLDEGRNNRLINIVSGDRKKDALYIHQNSEIDHGKLEKGKSISRKLSFSGNGFYIFVLEGEIETTGEKLSSRDAIGVWETDEIAITATTGCKFILIEVPMN